MSLRSNGSYIGPRPAGPSTSVASGIWDLRTAERQQRAAAWPVQVPTDPDFASVSLLLHMDGSDGSTAFTDSSPSPKTITRTGAVISTSESQFGGASGRFNGASRLSCGSSADFAFGTGAFTVEWWYKAAASQTYATIISIDAAGGMFIAFWEGKITLERKGNASDNFVTYAYPHPGGWSHYAICRESSTARFYVDGVQIHSGSNSINYSLNGPLLVGDLEAASTFAEANAWIDDLRITKGVCRYPGGTTFTPPTAAFPDA